MATHQVVPPDLETARASDDRRTVLLTFLLPSVAAALGHGGTAR